MIGHGITSFKREWNELDSNSKDLVSKVSQYYVEHRASPKTFDKLWLDNKIFDEELKYKGFINDF